VNSWVEFFGSTPPYTVFWNSKTNLFLSFFADMYPDVFGKSFQFGKLIVHFCNFILSRLTGWLNKVDCCRDAFLYHSLLLVSTAWEKWRPVKFLMNDASITKYQFWSFFTLLKYKIESLMLVFYIK